MLQLLGRLDEAMAMHHRALELREAGIAADPKNELLRGDLTITTELIGEVLAKQNDTAGALEWHRKTLTLREAVSAADPAFTDANRYIAITHTQLGDALLARNDFAAATEHFDKAQKLLEPLSISDPANLDVSRALAGCYSRFGKLQATMASKMKVQQIEHWQQARSWYQRSLDVWNSKMPGSALSPVDAQERQQATDELAKCDAALSKLKGG
jgi:tetratricopeptide (TPR) repeat protein